MLTNINNLKLAMAERTMMSDRKQDPEGKWIKTGEKTEKTTYTFKDPMTHEKLVFVGKNDFRGFEGEEVNIQVDLVYNEFDRKTRVSLKNVSKV